ncbi:hypothetical protein F5878DRAFT_647350, partial [Lentinula raphanica]
LKQKKTPASKKVDRGQNKFEPISSVIMPSSIPAWVKASQDVGRDFRESQNARLSVPRGYILGLGTLKESDGTQTSKERAKLIEDLQQSLNRSGLEIDLTKLDTVVPEWQGQHFVSDLPPDVCREILEEIIHISFKSELLLADRFLYQSDPSCMNDAVAEEGQIHDDLAASNSTDRFQKVAALPGIIDGHMGFGSSSPALRQEGVYNLFRIMRGWGFSYGVPAMSAVLHRLQMLVMEGETVSTTERAANLRQLLYPDDISKAGSSSSTHNDANFSHRDGPLAENQIPDLPDVEPLDEMPPESEQHSKKTQFSIQTGETLDQFIPELPRLLSLILSGEASEDIGTQCSCGQGTRLVQCHDCFKYETSCEACFIRRHYSTPFHWPRVWQTKGFFKKMDIACLRENTYAIDLCSRPFNGECLNASEPHGVTIIDSNGVHATHIRYCYCEGFPNYTTQLMQARLFPGTIFKNTISPQRRRLMTIVYVGALQRLSDGAFTLEVPDPYSQFVMAVRVWRHLCLLKWSGQAHDLGSSFPHRTPGSLVLFCPEDGYNMEIGWEQTPEHLKHLNQEQLKLDGNFHLQQLEKKRYSDPNDISLETANGIGYFPDEDIYREYQKASSDSSEKSTCSYLNIVNNQNKSKFKNMKITGVVNVVCSHSIIRSSVNLPKGEAHKLSDFALAHAHSHTRHNRNPSHLGVSDRMLSYDCNCQYCVKLEECFDTHFPELNAVIEQTRCSIPALHIEDHKDRCKYEFNSAYIPCSGHFYGENIEATYPVGLRSLKTHLVSLTESYKEYMNILNRKCPHGNKCINVSAMKEATTQMWPVDAQMYTSYMKDYAFNTSKFQDLQTILMPRSADLVAALPTCEVENEVLYLPSDVPQAQHVDWSLVELVEIEKRLREGELYDTLHSVRAATKAFSVTHVEKRDNS